MIYEHRRMKLQWVGVALFVLASCGTKPNPKSCADGICNDQAFPFCDVDGTLGGEPKECIAVACTADEFEACRGEQELRCNETGNNYDSVECELGCSAATDGCRLCEPNQTRCTNGKVASCDANGSITASETCELGCFEDKPRCRRLDPSNALGSYLDLPATLPDLDLTNASFDTATGVVVANGGLTIPVPHFSAANGDGPTIRVFVANNVRINGGSAGSTLDPDRVSGPAFALVARGTITIEGRFLVGATAGGIKSTACAGGYGNYFETDSAYRAVASGGGGNATSGGKGGDIGPSVGGAGGQAFGTDVLVPLKGGCPAGGVAIGSNIALYSTAGGGAAQFSSEKSIAVLGVIDARGKTGEAEQAGSIGAAVYGGGAGGSILLEAPRVELGPAAVLMAKGGGGGSYGPSTVSDDTANPDKGLACPGACADGGDGAAPNIAAKPGEPSPTSTGSDLTSGGGGGGLGRVRINTRDTTYQRPNTVVEAAMVTSGLIKTR
jgi:hypothetical protein